MGRGARCRQTQTSDNTRPRALRQGLRPLAARRTGGLQRDQLAALAPARADLPVIWGSIWFFFFCWSRLASSPRSMGQLPLDLVDRPAEFA